MKALTKALHARVSRPRLGWPHAPREAHHPGLGGWPRRAHAHHVQALGGQCPAVGAQARHADVGQLLLVTPPDPAIGLVTRVQSGPGQVMQRGGSVDPIGEPSLACGPALSIESGRGRLN